MGLVTQILNITIIIEAQVMDTMPEERDDLFREYLTSVNDTFSLQEVVRI